MRRDTSSERERSIQELITESNTAVWSAEERAASLAQQCDSALRERLPYAERAAREAETRAKAMKEQYHSLEQKVRRLLAAPQMAGPNPEAHFVKETLVPLLELLGWKPNKTLLFEYVVNLQSGSSRATGRVDILCVTPPPEQKPMMVIEAKATIRGEVALNEARGQAESYAFALKCPRFTVAAPEGIWFYRLSAAGSPLIETIPGNLMHRPEMVTKLQKVLDPQLH